MSQQHRDQLEEERQNHRSQTERLEANHAVERAHATAIRNELTQLSTALEARCQQTVKSMAADHRSLLVTKCLKQLVFVENHRGRQAMQRLFLRWCSLISLSGHVWRHRQDIAALETKRAADNYDMMKTIQRKDAQHKENVAGLESDHLKALMFKSLKHLMSMDLKRRDQALRQRFWRWYRSLACVRVSPSLYENESREQIDDEGQPFCFFPFASPSVAAPPTPSTPNTRELEELEAKHASKQAETLDRVLQMNSSLEARYQQDMENINMEHSEERTLMYLRRLFTMQEERHRRALQRSFTMFVAAAAEPLGSELSNDRIVEQLRHALSGSMPRAEAILQVQQVLDEFSQQPSFCVVVEKEKHNNADGSFEESEGADTPQKRPLCVPARRFGGY